MAQIVLFPERVYPLHQLVVVVALVASQPYQHQSMVAQAVQAVAVVTTVLADQGHQVKVLLVEMEVGLVPVMAAAGVAVLVQ
jgi:hypothetical protein